MWVIIGPYYEKLNKELEKTELVSMSNAVNELGLFFRSHGCELVCLKVKALTDKVN